MAKKAPEEQFEERRRCVALNVLRLRQEQNLTQQQLADAAEIDRTTLARFETRYINLTLDTFFALADALETEPQELLTTATEKEE